MLKQKLERLGKKFEATEDKTMRTSLMRMMICYFLNFVFWALLRSKKPTIQEMMESCTEDDVERIIELGEDYIIVEWQIASKDEERAKTYKINDIIVYCKMSFNKEGIIKKIEVE